MASSPTSRTLIFQIQITVLIGLFLCTKPSISTSYLHVYKNFINSPSSPSMSFTPILPAVSPYPSSSLSSFGFSQSPPSPTAAGAPNDIDISPQLPTPAPPSSSNSSDLPVVPSNPTPPNPESASSAKPYRRHGFDSIPPTPTGELNYSVSGVNPCLWLLGFSLLVLTLTDVVEVW